MGPGRLGHEASSMEVDEQAGRARLLLDPGQVGDGEGRRVGPGERQQLLTVLIDNNNNNKSH